MTVIVEVYQSDQEEIRNVMKSVGYQVYKEIIESGQYLDVFSHISCYQYMNLQDGKIEMVNL